MESAKLFLALLMFVAALGLAAAAAAVTPETEEPASTEPIITEIRMTHGPEIDHKLGLITKSNKTACKNSKDINSCSECCFNRGYSINTKLSFRKGHQCVCDSYAYV